MALVVNCTCTCGQKIIVRSFNVYYLSELEVGGKYLELAHRRSVINNTPTLARSYLHGGYRGGLGVVGMEAGNFGLRYCIGWAASTVGAI